MSFLQLVLSLDKMKALFEFYSGEYVNLTDNATQWNNKVDLNSTGNYYYHPQTKFRVR